MEDDEFGALYGDVVTASAPASNTETVTADESNKPTAPGGLGDDDDALFASLYGDQPAPEEPPMKPFDPYKATAQETTAAGNGHPPTSAAPPHPASEPAAGAGQEQEESDDDDDDLMITLDENATAYEPSQSRFQYQKPAAVDGAEAPQAVGAAPGQHLDDLSAAGAGAAIPGLGGFGSRTAIGGMPRSAIPGLGGTMPPPAPASAAATTTTTSERPVSQELPHTAAVAGGVGSAGALKPPPTRHLRPEDAVFPSQWQPGLPLKLPGQTRVSPEEYKEFLNLGHGDIFDVDLDSVIDAPWRFPGIDPGDFFNYGMNETKWKEYQEGVKSFRLEYTMKGQIQTLEQARAFQQQQQQQQQQQHSQQFSAPLMPGGSFLQSQETDEGDQALQSTMAELRDEHYEAFVTSERPPRAHWTRHSQPWEHTIILTGQDIVFEPTQENQPAPAPPSQQQQHQQQQQFPGFIPPQPRPPPPHPAGPSQPVPRGSFPPSGAPPGPAMALPPPFLPSGGAGGGGAGGGYPPQAQAMPPSHLPPPFFVSGSGASPSSRDGGPPPPPPSHGRDAAMPYMQRDQYGGHDDRYRHPHPSHHPRPPPPSQQQQQQQQQQQYGGGGLAMGMDAEYLGPPSRHGPPGERGDDDYAAHPHRGGPLYPHRPPGPPQFDRRAGPPPLRPPYHPGRGRGGGRDGGPLHRFREFGGNGPPPHGPFFGGGGPPRGPPGGGFNRPPPAMGGGGPPAGSRGRSPPRGGDWERERWDRGGGGGGRWDREREWDRERDRKRRRSRSRSPRRESEHRKRTSKR